MRGAREELGDAGPDLRDDRGGGQRADAGIVISRPARCERRHHRLDLRVSLLDYLFQMGDMVQVQPAHGR